MTQNSNEPRRMRRAGVREDRGGSLSATVAQPTDNAQQAGSTDPVPPEPSPVAGLWAQAETAWAMSDFLEYGSPAWEALDDTDPRKLAAMLSAAEKWRQL